MPAQQRRTTHAGLRTCEPVWQARWLLQTASRCRLPSATAEWILSPTSLVQDPGTSDGQAPLGRPRLLTRHTLRHARTWALVLCWTVLHCCHAVPYAVLHTDVFGCGGLSIVCVETCRIGLGFNTVPLMQGGDAVICSPATFAVTDYLLPRHAKPTVTLPLSSTTNKTCSVVDGNTILTFSRLFDNGLSQLVLATNATMYLLYAVRYQVTSAEQ